MLVDIKYLGPVCDLCDAGSQGQNPKLSLMMKTQSPLSLKHRQLYLGLQLLNPCHGRMWHTLRLCGGRRLERSDLAPMMMTTKKPSGSRIVACLRRNAMSWRQSRQAILGKIFPGKWHSY